MLSLLKHKLLQHYRQIARYAVIGILCFLVNYTIAIFLENHIHFMLSAALGYVVGVLLNYYLSIKWVFTKRELAKEWAKEFGYFILIEVCAMLFMLMSLYIIEHLLKVKFEVAIIIANFIAAVWNYTAKHIFLFRKHPESKE